MSIIFLEITCRRDRKRIGTRNNVSKSLTLSDASLPPVPDLGFISHTNMSITQFKKPNQTFLVLDAPTAKPP